MNRLVIGTRGSELALKQTDYVKSLLKKEFPDLDIQIQVVKTKGDINLEESIENLGGKSAFTTEIENQILSNNIHLAVHSLKDLPVDIMEGLSYFGSTQREDVRDVFISNKWKSISEIPINGVIATGSIRRKAQLLSIRPDLNIEMLRGNIDTRLKKLDNSNWDGIITAAAAMHRLELKNRISEYLDVKDFVPAACQGALGLEIKSDDKSIVPILDRIINKDVTTCCKAERLFLSKMQGGCMMPIGCLAHINTNQEFTLTGYIASTDGSKSLKKVIAGQIEFYEKLVLELSNYMLQNGAEGIIG